MENTQEKTSKSYERALISSAGSLRESDTEVKVSGSASISGGEIPKQLRISGSGRIEGDLRCQGLKSSGSLQSAGSITSQGYVKSSGSFKTEGSLQGSADAKFSGSVRIGQNVTIVGSVKSSGSFKVDGELDLGNNAKFSGSTKIGGETSIQGFTKASGSLKIKSNLQAVSGLSTSGFLGVDGNVLSQKDVSILGGSILGGNLVAENIDVGTRRWYSFLSLTISSAFKHPYKIQGSVFGKNKVDLTKTLVEGNVKGFDVKIGRKTKVNGQIYFVNSIKVKRSAKLSSDPIRIKPEELKL